MRKPDDKCFVRPAAPTDAREIAALINTAFLVEKFFLDGDRITAEEVQRLLDRGSFLLAEDPTGLSGCVYFETDHEHAYLGLLSVSPARQGEGLGRQLVAAAEDQARQSGCKFMDLRIVNLRIELRPFYRRLGYQEIGISPFPAEVPTKMPCHFIKMSKSLG